MQNGPPYPEQSVGPTKELPKISAFQTVSETTVQLVGWEPSPKAVRIGDVMT